MNAGAIEIAKFLLEDIILKQVKRNDRGEIVESKIDFGIVYCCLPNASCLCRCKTEEFG